MSGDEPDRRPTEAAKQPSAPVTDTPPPRRPATLGGAPPPLRPPEADKTIPLGPPEPTTVAQPRPPTPAPPAPSPPAPPPPRPVPSEPDLANDDEVEEHLERGLRTPAPIPHRPGTTPADDPADEARPPRARPWAGWLMPSAPREPGTTAVRLSRHLSYEVVVTVVTFLVASVLLFTSFQGEMRDVYVKGRQAMGLYPAAVSEEVVLVTVGPEGLYLWDPSQTESELTPRGLLGELVSVLDQAGANVIVLDFLLDTPAPGDDRLAEAAAAHGAVLAAERFVITDHATGGAFAAGPTPTLGDHVATGFANLGEEALWTTSEERLVRSTRLVERLDRARISAPWPASVGQVQAEGELTPHLGLLAAWTHRRLQAGEAAAPGSLFAALDAACTGSPLACDTDLAGLGLPAGPSLASQLPINFRGPEGGDGIPTLRAAQLLRIAGEPALYRQLGLDRPLAIPDWLRERVEGRVVLIGRVDTRANDRFATPFSFPIPVGADMDGCRIQAQLIDTLLSGRHVRSAPTWSMVGLAALLLTGLVLTARRLREDVHTLGWIGVGVGLVALGTLVFVVTDGLVIGLSIPLTSILLGIVAVRLRGWAID